MWLARIPNQWIIRTMLGLKYITYITECEHCGMKHTRLRLIPLQEKREDGNNYFAICDRTGKAMYKKLKMAKLAETPKKLRKRKVDNTKIKYPHENVRKFREDHEVKRQ